MNNLVTGGAGFIGSHLVECLLSRGEKVTVLDNFSTGHADNLAEMGSAGTLTVVNADVSSLDDIKSCFKDVDRVFHLAALADIVPSITNPMAYYASNVLGTANVVEAARLANVKKLVYAASSSCYGIPGQYPTREEALINPRYPYALTKYLGEQTVLHWGQVYKLPVLSLRLFNVFGPKSRTSGTYGAVFGTFIAQKLAGKPFTVVGDGKQTRDFIYVSDIVDAFIAAASSDVSGEALNVGNGNPVSVNRLVELLGGEVTYIPKRPGEPDCTHADITKVRELLGWRPKIGFEKGVERMLENIDHWREAPVWTPDKIANATRDWFKYL